MNNEIQIYQSPDGQMQLDVQMDNQMVLLFESSTTNISEHLKFIFLDKELDKSESTVRKFRTVQKEGTAGKQGIRILQSCDQSKHQTWYPTSPMGNCKAQRFFGKF